LIKPFHSLCFVAMSGFPCSTETQQELDRANFSMRLQLEVTRTSTEAGILMFNEIQAVRNELAAERRTALYVAQQLRASQARAADLQGQLVAAKLEMASLEQQLAAAQAGPVGTMRTHATDMG
jgi:chromosome segregation ATPase